MTWFAFKGYNAGKAIDLAGLQEKDTAALGFHGYGTEKEAEAKPNSVNVLSAAYVNTMIADYRTAVRQGAQPGGPNDITTPGGFAGAVVQGNPVLSGLNATGDFFQRLTQAATWTRVLKVALGAVLLAEGIMRASGTGLTPLAILGAQAGKPVKAAKEALL